MVARGKFTRDPWDRIPFPTKPEPYGTTGKLFAKIKGTIAEQTHLSAKDCALPAFWVFSTWLRDFLPLAPGLLITGCAHEGNVVLRTLNALCYHPLLLTGLNDATLNNIDWERKPTLLISEPNLSRRMAAILGNSTCRGYMALRKQAGCPNYACDYYGSKAVYVGEDPPAKAVLQHYLHVNASPARGVESQPALPISQEATQSYQNQLFHYRAMNLAEVSTSDIGASRLSSEVNAIATSLARSIVDAPDLQAELLTLLKPVSQQQINERLDDLGTLALGAALFFAHQGKDMILVGEIAMQVNRWLKGRGERLDCSAEKVGHRLKKAGLPSRRLGAAGMGYVLDHTTMVSLHQIAATYGCVGLTDQKENLQCSLCEQYK